MSDVDRLLEAMGLTEKLRQGVEAMLVSLRATLAAGGVTPEKWAAIEVEIRERPLALFREATAGAFTLSPEEVDAVVAFYQSPKGKRVMEKMTLVNQAVGQATQAWAENQMRLAIEKVGV